MSTLKADAVTTKSDNTDLTITGGGSGVPNLEAGFKVGGTAGVPVTELRTGTDGELITWDASGDPATVAVGTSTHVLTSNGAGAAPTFQAAGGGGQWTEASSGTWVSAATANFTGITGTTRLYLYDLVKSAAGAFRMRTSADGGSSYDDGSSNYSSCEWGLAGDDSSMRIDARAASTTSVQIDMVDSSIGDAVTDDIVIEICIWNPEDTAKNTMWSWEFMGSNNDTQYVNLSRGIGQRVSAAVVDAFQIHMSTGNIAGSYKLYTLT